MVPKASTQPDRTAKGVPDYVSMSRIILAVFVFLLLLAAGGMLFLGAFPPHPRVEQVERVLPNDRFGPK